MITYELVTIHSPVLSDQQYREQLDRVKDVITRNGGTIRLEDVWGRRRLAYTLKKQREGNYAVIQFDCPSTGQCLPELDRFCKIEETVLRFLVTRAVLNKSLGTPVEQRPPAETAEGAGAARGPVRRPIAREAEAMTAAPAPVGEDVPDTEEPSPFPAEPSESEGDAER